MGSSIVEAVRGRLRIAEYEDLPTPFRVAGVEFQFTGAMRGRHGRALDLVLLIDTTAGDFGDSDPARVRHRVQALSRALDVTGSRYVLTTILAGAALAADMESLAETCRLLLVDGIELTDTGAPDGQAALNQLEDKIRVLLPLCIPQEPSEEEIGSVQEQLTRALPAEIDSDFLQLIMEASEHGEAAVLSAIGRILNRALEFDIEEEKT